MAVGHEVNRAQVIQYCMRYLEEYYDIFRKSGDMSLLMEEYNRMLVSVGSQVCVLEPSGEYRGISEGINQSGELLVRRMEGRLEQVYAGEVSVRGVYGYV